jgi:hypothetical protein
LAYGILALPSSVSSGVLVLAADVALVDHSKEFGVLLCVVLVPVAKIEDIDVGVTAVLPITPAAYKPPIVPPVTPKNANGINVAKRIVRFFLFCSCFLLISNGHIFIPLLYSTLVCYNFFFSQ